MNKEQNERAELDKIVAQMKAHIMSPALSAKERDEAMIKFLRETTESTNDTVFGKYIHQHGGLLLAQFDKQQFGVLTLVDKFGELLQLGRELQEECDKADAQISTEV